MNRPCDEFLSAAGLADNQDVRVGRRGGLNAVE